MNAVLNSVGKTPDGSDLLYSSVRNGANKSTLSLSRCVGIGSVAHCLFGNLRIMATMSSVLTTRKADRSQSYGAGTQYGGGASAVEARTPAILSSKQRCRSLASTVVDSGTRPRPTSVSMDCHKRHGDDRSDSTLAC